jgi:hypothetical protein
VKEGQGRAGLGHVAGIPLPDAAGTTYRAPTCFPGAAGQDHEPSLACASSRPLCWSLQARARR